MKRSIHIPAIHILAIGATLGITGGIAAPGLAQDAAKSPNAVAKVFECRAIADDTARLACFDRSVAEFETARTKGDVAIVDREDVRQTRRKLFGFSIPDFGIFGGHKDEHGRDEEDKDEVKEIVGTIKAVARGRDGFIVTLDDGARWAQTDGKVLGRSPKPGEPVTIKRGVLGSYKMSFKIGPGVKARRVE